MKNRILLLFLLSGIFLASSGQEKNPQISLRKENSTLRDVLKTLATESGYSIYFDEALPVFDTRVTVRMKKVPLTTLLDSVLLGTGLRYKMPAPKMVVVAPPAAFNKKEITGRVIDDKTGETIPGANIMIRGTSTGTITGADGRFRITVPSGDAILEISFIGYDKVVLPAAAAGGRSIRLREASEQLKEVVVTALGIKRETKALGYAVSEVKGDEVSEARDKNIMNSLSGKVAGLQVSRTASGVGGSSRIVIRGISSLLGSNKPLFVIDGVPMDASNLGQAGQWGGRDMGDGISDINPDDIESISILKGPAAAAAYGSRGANGVVLITTKSGSRTQKFGISFSSSYTNDTPLVMPHLQNTYGLGAYGVYPPITNEGVPSPEYPWVWSFGPVMDGQPRINWLGEEQPFTAQPNNYRDYFRNGSNMTNTIALEGGNDKSHTRFSFSDVRSYGLVPNNKLDRQTINLRGDAKMGNIIEMDGRITYVRQHVYNRPILSEDDSNPVYMLEFLPRNLRLEDLKNNIVDENGVEKNWMSDIFSGNPYWVLEKVGTRDEKNRVMSSVSMKLNFSEWLSMQGRTGLDFYTFKAKEWQANNSKTTSRGHLSLYQQNVLEWNSDFLLSFNKKLSETFTVAASIGGNYRYHQYQNLAGYGSQFNIDGFYHMSNTTGTSSSEYLSEKAVYSAYGLGSVSYKDFLFADFTLRNDWSSTLPPQNNSYFYHSENLGFVFTDAFDLDNWWFSFGKVRASYAAVGNDTSPYATQQYYFIHPDYTYPTGSISSALPFYDFKPEQKKGWEVGTNLMFFNRRIEIDFSYFNGYAQDQIMSVPLSPFTGYSSKKFNAGRIKGHGVELMLNATPVRTESGFTWDLTVNYSSSRSIVEEIHPSLDKLVLGTLWSASIQARPGELFGGIYGLDYKRDKFGNKLIDENGFAQKGEISLLGDIQPDFIGGIQNKVHWKGFDLSFLIDIQVGGEFFSWGKAMRSLFGTAAETLEGRAEWYATHDPNTNYQTPLPGVKPDGYYEEGVQEKNGRPNDIPIQPIWRWYNIYANDIATEWIVDATNLRMREMILGYTFPKKLLNKTPISSLNVSFIGRNLFFIYRASPDADPESGFNSGNIGNGFENHALPTTRSLGVNFRIAF